jgi:hypothetical protein
MNTTSEFAITNGTNVRRYPRLESALNATRDMKRWSFDWQNSSAAAAEEYKQHLAAIEAKKVRDEVCERLRGLRWREGLVELFADVVVGLADAEIKQFQKSAEYRKERRVLIVAEKIKRQECAEERNRRREVRRKAAAEEAARIARANARRNQIQTGLLPLPEPLFSKEAWYLNGSCFNPVGMVVWCKDVGDFLLPPGYIVCRAGDAELSRLAKKWGGVELRQTNDEAYGLSVRKGSTRIAYLVPVAAQAQIFAAQARIALRDAGIA